MALNQNQLVKKDLIKYGYLNKQFMIFRTIDKLFINYTYDFNLINMKK